MFCCTGGESQEVEDIGSYDVVQPQRALRSTLTPSAESEVVVVDGVHAEAAAAADTTDGVDAERQGLGCTGGENQEVEDISVYDVVQVLEQRARRSTLTPSAEPEVVEVDGVHAEAEATADTTDGVGVQRRGLGCRRYQYITEVETWIAPKDTTLPQEFPVCVTIDKDHQLPLDHQLSLGIECDYSDFGKELIIEKINPGAIFVWNASVAHQVEVADIIIKANDAAGDAAKMIEVIKAGGDVTLLVRKAAPTDDACIGA